MSRFLLDLMKLVDLLTSKQKKEEQRPKTIFGLVRVYTNIHIIIYSILTYNFSELNLHTLFYIFIINRHVIS